MTDLFIGLLGLLWLFGLFWLLSVQITRVPKENMQKEIPNQALSIMPDTIVPMEDRIVPTQPFHGNKFNDVIGNYSSGLMHPAPAEVVIPSDYFYWPYLPSEFDGPFWPAGSSQPDYLYPGGSRPLRRPDLPSSYSIEPDIGIRRRTSDLGKF